MSKFIEIPELEDDDWDDLLNKGIHPLSNTRLILRQVKRQRLANKVVKDLYNVTGQFSFHNMIMAVFNLARVEAIDFAKHKITAESAKVWKGRYYRLFDFWEPKRRDPEFRRELIKAQKEWLADPNRY